MDNNKKDFKPYIPADKVVPEFTVTALLIGILLAIVFGAANAYLGLLVGMTVSASIPAAVISMGIIRVILRKDSILENNMVQTIGSAGESVAAGAIFTLPALFLWAEEGKIAFPSILSIALIALVEYSEYASWYRFVRLLSLKSTEHFLSRKELLVQKFFWLEKKVDLRLVQYSQDLVSQPFTNSLQTERSSSQVRLDMHSRTTAEHRLVCRFFRHLVV